MSKEGENILKHESNEKPLPIPNIICVDLETITQNIDTCKPNKDKSYTEKEKVHIPCLYSLNLLKT